MTQVIRVRNVNQALGEGFWLLKTSGADEPSRAGPVRVARGPVVTEYSRPTERVLFNADRDANGVFHLLEALWMLAGDNHNQFLLPYNARMAEYSEPDGTIHGAYGHRWRRAFGIDQIDAIIKELRMTPSSRQCVLQMWDAGLDLGVDKRDRPCNTHVYFDARPDSLGHRYLNMTVCCRSNDALWGAYGANVVHFSILQELIAAGVGVPVGEYRQISNNFHAYWNVPVAKKFLELPPPTPRNSYPAEVIPLVAKGETYQDFLRDCLWLVTDRPAPRDYTTSFFRSVVLPLKDAYDARRAGLRTWRAILDSVADCDWKLAFQQWADRRKNEPA